MTSDIAQLHTKVESILNDVDDHIDAIADLTHEKTGSSDSYVANATGNHGPDGNEEGHNLDHDVLGNEENINPLTSKKDSNGVNTNKQNKSTSHRKPITFKVRRVNHEPNINVKGLQHQRKQLDLVQSQYDQVSNRIHKIHKEVKFLRNLLPPYNLEIDYSTRVKIDKSIDKLLARADELNKEKHHLGITLSRIWRDFDDSDLWVRNVSH